MTVAGFRRGGLGTYGPNGRCARRRVRLACEVSDSYSSDSIEGAPDTVLENLLSDVRETLCQAGIPEALFDGDRLVAEGYAIDSIFGVVEVSWCQTHRNSEQVRRKVVECGRALSRNEGLVAYGPRAESVRFHGRGMNWYGARGY